MSTREISGHLHDLYGIDVSQDLIGTVTDAVLATLLGELPEPGTLCRRKIASLAGLAPHARESGTWRGARRIWGGRRKVRKALYIAALNASRRIPIVIAVARQILAILDAMIRKQQPIALG